MIFLKIEYNNQLKYKVLDYLGQRHLKNAYYLEKTPNLFCLGSKLTFQL